MTKREAILAAATMLFARQGYKGAAVSEIAEQADVAQGTIFHHFKSKENLLISICDNLVQSYIAGIREAARGGGSGWEALERVLKFNEKFSSEHRDSITVVFRETRDLPRSPGEINEHFCGLVNQIIDVKSQCIEKGIKDGSIRPVPAQLTALLVHFLLIGKFHVETEGLLEVPEMNAEFLEFCRRSLAAQAPSAVVDDDKCGG
jgi:AcrR family transcriptional regulator